MYYAEVYGDGSGIVEFASKRDAEDAVKTLDNTKFKSHEVNFIYIRGRGVFLDTTKFKSHEVTFIYIRGVLVGSVR